jgi:hypothetical protein
LKPPPKSDEKDETSVEDQLSLANEITSTFNLVKKQIDRHRKLVRLANKEDPMDTSGDQVSIIQKYKVAMKSIQFGESCMMDDAKKEYVHHYKSRFVAETVTATGITFRSAV